MSFFAEFSGSKPSSRRASPPQIRCTLPVFRLSDALAFPRPEVAEPSGLLAVGGDLCTERLLLAYAMGIFPWYSEGEPILWFSPPERMLLPLADLHINRSLRKAIRKHPYRLTLDTAFEAVLTACSEVPRPDQDGTWITADMRAAYVQLHAEGFAHSVEAWRGDELVGGLYGVSLARRFLARACSAERTTPQKSRSVTSSRS